MPARMTAYSAIACPDSDMCLPRATAEGISRIRLKGKRQGRATIESG